jgi:VanZ family protein
MEWLQAVLSRKALGRLTLLLVVAMAFACFWPFSAPRNSASWSAAGHAVAFGKHGVLLGPAPLRPDDVADSGCTLHLWVEPDQADAKGAILAAYSPANPRLLIVEQFGDGLAVRSLAPRAPARTGGAQLYVDRVFAPGKLVLLTLTSDGRGTTAFVNGVFRKTVPDFQICRALFTGKLVAGTSAASGYGWQGRLAGIAVFDRALGPEEVRQDYDAWPRHPGPALGNRAGVIALYLFDEGSGTRVRDEISGANSFYMPGRYLVVAKRFLSPPSLDNPADIVANIMGFMPLGFTLCGYLSFRWGIRTAVVITVLLCGLFSLTIEMLQWFLPTRDSDMTDVITNTAGAAGGALLYRLSRVWSTLVNGGTGQTCEP